MSERLQKLMARSGLGSRRQNEALIAAGRVRVNGRVARLGDKANPAIDIIEVDGKRLTFPANIYLLLHKPKGVISSNEDELARGRQTVRSLVDLPGHLFPVGRLDKQSEGLMILTNDGALANRLTHPRYGHQKVYRVAVHGNPSESSLKRWREGIVLDGRKTAPVQISVIKQEANETWLQVTMYEGRKRQIRRVSAFLGHPVKRLIRDRIGPVELGDLAPGKWRLLTESEIASLRSVAFKPGGGHKRRDRKAGTRRRAD